MQSITTAMIWMWIVVLSWLGSSAYAKSEDVFDCARVITRDGAAPIDLRPAFASGALTAVIEQATPPTTTVTSVRMDLCSPLARDKTLSDEDQCPANTHVCMTVANRRKDGAQAMAQVIPVAGTPQGLTVEHAKFDTGQKEEWQLAFPGAVWADKAQHTKLTVTCAVEGDVTGTLSIRGYNVDEGQLTLQWDTPLACADLPTTPPRPPPRTKHRRGWFARLCWLIIIGMLIYLAVGVWYNYTQYGATGWDLLPHRDFWRDVPYRLRTGWQQGMRTATAGRRTDSFSRAGYEPV
ncbi:type II membrane protein [Malassezia pachydermatis]